MSYPSLLNIFREVPGFLRDRSNHSRLAEFDSLPQGGGQPVLFLGGLFLPNPVFYKPLTSFLEELGYRPTILNPVRWGYNAERFDEVMDAVDNIHEESDGARVPIICHSSSCHVANAAAFEKPDKVAAIITKGSPIKTIHDGQGVSPLLHGIFNLLSDSSIGRKRAELVSLMTQDPPRNIPFTHIFSPDDGVVGSNAAVSHWLEQQHPLVEGIKINGSHLGLPVNPWALIVLADRLAAAHTLHEHGEGWSPFTWDKYPLAKEALNKHRGREVSPEAA